MLAESPEASQEQRLRSDQESSVCCAICSICPLVEALCDVTFEQQSVKLNVTKTSSDRNTPVGPCHDEPQGRLQTSSNTDVAPSTEPVRLPYTLLDDDCHSVCDDEMKGAGAENSGGAKELCQSVRGENGATPASAVQYLQPLIRVDIHR